MRNPGFDTSNIQIYIQHLLSGVLAQKQSFNYLNQEFGDVFVFLWQLYLAQEYNEVETQYTSKNFDPDINLYYYNARWYDPELGRFTTEDPARDGNNWYLYVWNNPLTRIDPTGLELRVVDEGDDRDRIVGDLQTLDPSVQIDEETGLITQDPDVDITGFQKGHDLIKAAIEALALIRIYESSGYNRQEFLDASSIPEEDANSTWGGNLQAATSPADADYENDITFPRGAGSGSIIAYNTNGGPPMALFKNNEIYAERTASFIALGHELIHSVNAAYGSQDDSKNVYMQWKGLAGETSHEELATSGIYFYLDPNSELYERSRYGMHGASPVNFNVSLELFGDRAGWFQYKNYPSYSESPISISENDLRLEHDLGIRMVY